MNTGSQREDRQGQGVKTGLQRETKGRSGVNKAVQRENRQVRVAWKLLWGLRVY